MDLLLLRTAFVLFPAAVVGQPPLDVLGVSNSSRNLTTSFDPPPIEVTWRFELNGQWTLIAKIKNGVSNLNSRYKQYLNGAVLGIDNLTKKDSGVYTADCTFLNGTTREQKFNVTVHDPVPPPQIIFKAEGIGDQCNITLHCSVQSNTPDLSNSWKYRNRDSEYQTINNTGNRIQRRLPLDHEETEFMCTVQNPADQKNVSVHIEHCSEKLENGSHITIVVFIITMLTVAGVIVAVAMLVWTQYLKKRSSNPTEKGDQKKWRRCQKIVEMKIRQKNDHPNKSGYVEVQLEDISDQDEEVRTHGVEVYENEENKKKEHLMNPFGDARDQDEEERTRGVEEHEIEEHENNEQLINPSGDTRDQEEEVRTHVVEEHKNNEQLINPLKGTHDPDEEVRPQGMEEHENDELENQLHFITPSTDTCEQDGEVQARGLEEHENDEHENEEHLTTPVKESCGQVQVEEHENPENEEHLTIAVKESSGHDEERQAHRVEKLEKNEKHPNKNENRTNLVTDTNDQDEGRAEDNDNKVKEHENRTEHENEENLSVPVQETGIHKKWRADLDENEMKKDGHPNNYEYIIVLLHDSNDQDEQMQKDKADEDEEKDDYENEEDVGLIEEETDDQK